MVGNFLRNKTNCQIELAGWLLPNAGIAVPGTPSEMTRNKSASDRSCTSFEVRSAAATALPFSLSALPLAAWQVAQCESKWFRPRARFAWVSSGGFLSGVCAGESACVRYATKKIESEKKAITTANLKARRFLAFMI